MIEFVKRIQACLGPNDRIARFGGDEFALTVADCPADAELLTFGERICMALRKPFALPEATVQLSGSIGFAVFPEMADCAHELYERADYALYQGKRSNRGHAVLFSSDHVDEIEQEEQQEETGSAAPSEEDEEDDDRRSKKRRKRRRRGKGRDEERDESDSQDAVEASDDNEDDRDDSRGGKRKRRRSRGRRGGRDRRPFRLPDAEPVGPLADMIVAEAAEQEAENRRKAEEAAKAAEEQAAAEQTAQAEAAKASEAPAAEQPVAEEPANDEAPKEAAVANDNAAEADEAEAEEKPSRRRATAETLDLDAEPVVTSEGTAAEEKPKRTGWWSRKGFF